MYQLLCFLLFSALCYAALQPGRFPTSFVEELPDPPPWRVHAYNNATYILRQSGMTDYEKPFLYLLFGQDKAFLFDTGSRNVSLAPVITQVLHRHMAGDPSKSALQLVVGHSHSHWDHTGCDKEMKDFAIPQLNITSRFIAPNVASVISGYDLQNWPQETGVLDLGSRLLDIIPLPGHTPDAVAVYDRQTGLLLTGDSVYPGRIFVPRHAVTTFKQSHKRLMKFASSHKISWLLGCHIEQKKTPFKEYPMGTRIQPHEHDLQMDVSALRDVEDALQNLDDGMEARQFMFAEFSLVIPDEEDEEVQHSSEGGHAYEL